MGWFAPMLAALLLAPGVGYAQSHQIGENVTYGYAQVLRASPVYQAVRTQAPGRRCDRLAGKDGGDPAGGVPCRAVEVEREERRLTGYDVEYQYKGERYMSRLAKDPGNRLRIRVSVMPEETPVGNR